jgi:putative nucleotidyltransferase with HDIG domain
MHNDPSPLHPSLFERLRRDPDILTLIEKADNVLATLGYTDHGRRHVTLVAVNAAKLLALLGYDRRESDLAAVAGLLHDIGNCAGREGHAAVGATMAYQLLTERGVTAADVADVMAAIGNHDETEGGLPVNPPGAALILADKADIHRTRVRGRNRDEFDVHDRANFAVIKADLSVDVQQKSILLSLTADHEVATPEEIADLFALRFEMCDAAARFLGCRFAVEVDGQTLP